MGIKEKSFGVNYQKNAGKMAPNKLKRDVCGDTDLYKVCCDLYSTFCIYACHWIILSYTTFFISLIYLWLLISFYPLQVCSVSLTSFKYFRMFWPSSFVYPSVKGTNNFWKVRGIIDGFNKSHRQIASGVGKMSDESMSDMLFFTTPKGDFRTNYIFLVRRIHWGHRWRMWHNIGWG